MSRRGTDWNRIHRARLREIKRYVTRKSLPKSSDPRKWSRAEKRRVRNYHRRIHGTRTKNPNGQPLKGSRHLAFVTIDGQPRRKMRAIWETTGLRNAGGYLAKEYRPKTRAAREAAFDQFGAGVPRHALTTVWIPSEHPETMSVRFRKATESFSLSFRKQKGKRRVREWILRPNTAAELREMLADPRGWAEQQTRRFRRHKGEQYWRIHTVSGMVGLTKADAEFYLDSLTLPSADAEGFIDQFEKASQSEHMERWFSHVSLTIIG